MKYILALLTLISLHSFAANTFKKVTTTTEIKNNYLISVSLYINDKKVNAASFGVTEGEKGSIEMKENFIDVTLIKPDHSHIENFLKMSFTVGHINEKGEKTIVATPTVITGDNKMATLVFTANNGEDTYKIEMTPKKIEN